MTKITTLSFCYFTLVYTLTIKNVDAFTMNGMSVIQSHPVSRAHFSHVPFSLLKMSDDDDVSAPPPSISAMESLQNSKDNLVRACEAQSPNKDTILNLVRELEDMGEQVS